MVICSSATAKVRGGPGDAGLLVEHRDRGGAGASAARGGNTRQALVLRAIPPDDLSWPTPRRSLRPALDRNQPPRRHHPHQRRARRLRRKRLGGPQERRRRALHPPRHPDTPAPALRLGRPTASAPSSWARPPAPSFSSGRAARTKRERSSPPGGSGSRQAASAPTKKTAPPTTRAGSAAASAVSSRTPASRPSRLHGLRHEAATLALTTGTDLKVVQERLGHSTITLTADTDTSVLTALSRAGRGRRRHRPPQRAHAQSPSRRGLRRERRLTRASTGRRERLPQTSSSTRRKTPGTPRGPLVPVQGARCVTLQRGIRVILPCRYDIAGHQGCRLTRETFLRQNLRCGAGGTRTHGRRIMSPLL